MKEKVLVIPPGYDGPIDPAVDRVETDPRANGPSVKEVHVSDAGESVIDRQAISGESHGHIRKALRAYDAANDPEEEVKYLRTVVFSLLEIVTGNDPYEEILNNPDRDDPSGDTL
ncbi:hypothetical protein HTZ84_09455 [Haloterrigena sp. SYSU A558-1]|uniref:Uncharacterized protein n=1 Tax=Haloterrigena gelatinilytica TaxID=2741724 RepID=A0ABX2LFB2_9EURY|nr:hypothetical protein [Haloterrigena gelatinilytica]NUC72531.1 hypothetical protein [Haloterrigena gelatinilytica]